MEGCSSGNGRSTWIWGRSPPSPPPSWPPWRCRVGSWGAERSRAGTSDSWPSAGRDWTACGPAEAVPDCCYRRWTSGGGRRWLRRAHCGPEAAVAGMKNAAWGVRGGSRTWTCRSSSTSEGSNWRRSEEAGTKTRRGRGRRLWPVGRSPTGGAGSLRRRQKIAEETACNAVDRRSRNRLLRRKKAREKDLIHAKDLRPRRPRGRPWPGPPWSRAN